ncbi:hypothetical protein [Paenibacillus sp. FSL M7-1046]
MTQVPKKTKTYQNSQSISGIFREITGLTLIGKMAHVKVVLK